MENEKSSGTDGLTVEFYKTLWNTLRIFFVDSINYSFETGSLSTLQEQGHPSSKRWKKSRKLVKLPTYHLT